MVEQEQLDNMMIQMDGTENKCESQRVVINSRPVQQHPESIKMNAEI